LWGFQSNETFIPIKLIEAQAHDLIQSPACLLQYFIPSGVLMKSITREELVGMVRRGKRGNGYEFLDKASNIRIHFLFI